MLRARTDAALDAALATCDGVVLGLISAKEMIFCFNDLRAREAEARLPLGFSHQRLLLDFHSLDSADCIPRAVLHIRMLAGSSFVVHAPSDSLPRLALLSQPLKDLGGELRACTQPPAQTLRLMLHWPPVTK